MTKEHDPEGLATRKLSQEERERFWARFGWSPDLPREKREQIERQWPDPAIREALALGF